MLTVFESAVLEYMFTSHVLLAQVLGFAYIQVSNGTNATSEGPRICTGGHSKNEALQARPDPQKTLY